MNDEIALVSLMSYETTYNGEKVYADLSSFDNLEVGKQYIFFLLIHDEMHTILPLEFRQFQPASFPYVFSYDGTKDIKVIEKNTEIKSGFKEGEIKYDDLEKLMKEIGNQKSDN